ncbi:MAG: glycerol dehydrogenase [Methanomassiliicoccales archaeon]|nr:glycerol dehydrogenase [Methanomassiliicoccales archaeon]
MISREVAWRVFAGEYNSSNLEIKGEGERAPSYIVTPLGAMINRVFLVGVLTDLDNIGTGGEPLWRARLSDPTGTFYVSSGQYQPEATATLSKIEPPAFIAVVGKTRTYSPEEGTMYVSIRPEKVTVVDAGIRDYWVLEACRSTLRRIEAMSDAKEMAVPTVDELVKLGHSRLLSEGVVKACEHYKDVDLSRYRGMVVDALRYLLPEYRREQEAEMPKEMASSPEEIEEEEEAKEVDREEQVLALITALDKNGKGAPWDQIVDEVKKVGLDKAQLEEVTNSLLDKGMIYEPVLGRMKRI